MSRSVNIKEKMKFPSHAPLMPIKVKKNFSPKTLLMFQKKKIICYKKNPDFSPKKLNLQ